MLSGEEFGERTFFQEQIQANRPINLALRALNSKEPDWQEAERQLDEFFRTPPGRIAAVSQRKAIFDTLAARPSSRRALVELQADISSLSPTAHIITRTRKSEVMTQRAQRVPGWKYVTLSPTEQDIYRRAEELCRLVSGSPVSDWGLLMVYRMTASCIPAAMEYFKERLRAAGQLDNIEEVEDFPGDEENSSQRAFQWTASTRGSLAEALAKWGKSVPIDSKLEKFLEVLENSWSDDKANGGPRRKVVLFSFFRRTLDYLHRALTARGIETRIMHGGYSVADRERTIEEFLEQKDVDVLLTSDVGGEGIDLQRASILINYDLPWNPMVVEQRIGRLDRIGQASERILIVNLVVEGSVEQRILQRLLTKIRVFEDSIGELDGIVGEEFEKLTSDVLSGRIPPQDIERVLQEKGDAAERIVREAHELKSRVDHLLAADQGLLDEIEAVTGERQIPTSEELLAFVNGTLAQRFPGSLLPKEVISRAVVVDLRGQLGTALENWSLNAGEGPNLFARRICARPISLTLSRDAAVIHRGAELVHLNHPLVRFCLDQRQKEVQTNVPYTLRLGHSEILPPGQYAFSIHFVETQGSRVRTNVHGVFASLTGERTWTDADDTRRIVLELLDHAEDVTPPQISAETTMQLEKRLGAALDSVVHEIEVLERRLTVQRSSQLHSTHRALAEHRLQREQARLAQLRQSNAPSFPVRMAEARLRKAEEALRQFSGQESVRDMVSITPEEVAVGVLIVGAV